MEGRAQRPGFRIGVDPERDRPHQGLLAQRFRALASHARGHWFKSSRAHFRDAHTKRPRPRRPGAFSVWGLLLVWRIFSVRAHRSARSGTDPYAAETQTNSAWSVRVWTPEGRMDEGRMCGRVVPPSLHTSSHPTPNSASDFGITSPRCPPACTGCPPWSRARRPRSAGRGPGPQSPTGRRR